MMDKTNWLALFLIACCFVATGFTLDIANRQLNYVKAHPIVVTRIVTVVKWRTAPDLNADRYTALHYCRGDNGAPTLVFFWMVPNSWEALCSGGHEVYTSNGFRVTQ
jgi:hypothetical protein